MQFLNLFTKSAGLCAIALAGLVGCTQPTSPQSNASSPSDPVAQSSDTQVAQTTTANNADDQADNAADRVEEAFDKNETLKSFDLDVDDEDNAVVIEGTVSDPSQITLAEDIAKQAAPGVAIINRISVK